MIKRLEKKVHHLDQQPFSCMLRWDIHSTNRIRSSATNNGIFKTVHTATAAAASNGCLRIFWRETSSSARSCCLYPQRFLLHQQKIYCTAHNDRDSLNSPYICCTLVWIPVRAHGIVCTNKTSQVSAYLLNRMYQGNGTDIFIVTSITIFDERY